RDRATPNLFHGNIARRTQRAHERSGDGLLRMADQEPASRRYFEGATAARGSLARGKRPRTRVRAAAGVLPAVATIESRGRMVARESSNLRSSRRVRLDHESRGFRIDHDVREQEWRSRLFLRNPKHWPHV